MGCSNCKKKKEEVKKITTKPIIETDRVITWGIVGWFFLGLYGLYDIVSYLIKLIF